ncbi:MAG: serine/threonine-protein kinase [Acidobacteriota bacterium]
MEPTKRIGDYEVLEEIGRGGMGRVYRVRNVISDRVEAMKVLLPDLVGRQDLAARFIREIKLLAALNHPNIAQLRTALSTEHELVMIMEFVEGESLANCVKRGRLSTDDALSYVDQALEALQYAHGQHVIHRDIKPANMMVTPDGVVKLTDFGIARSRNDQTLTAAGTTTGSLSYMSPEQINGETTDARSDLYSLGISLYELVTGQRPFEADSDFAVMVAHLNQAPRPPIELDRSLAPELNAIILKAIAKAPEDRFQSAREFREALNALRTASTTIAGLRGPVTSATAPRAAASATPTAVTVLPPKGVPPVPVAAAIPPDMPGMPPPAAKSGHPAVYVALGAVLVIGALVGAGLYIGRAEADPGGEAESPPLPMPAAADASAVSPAAASTPGGISASAATTDAPSAATSPATPATPAPATTSTAAAEPSSTTAATGAAAPALSAPSSPGAAPEAETGAPAGTSRELQALPAATARGAGRPVPTGKAARQAVSRAFAREADRQASGAASPSTGTTAAAEPAAPAQAAGQVDFEELEAEIDQLIIRGAAVTRSLNVMQREQAQQGLGLRGDISARLEAMKLNLTRAQEAVTARNAPRALRFKALAEGDVEALERFLGR